MKNIILCIALLSALVSCAEQKKTTERILTSVDSIMANPAEFVDKEVVVTGTVSHVCRHGGQKLFIFGENADKFIQVNTGNSQPEFDVALEGTEVQIDGIMKELRIDENYVASIEKEGREADTLTSEGKPDSLNIHQREQQMANASYLRKQIAESGKDYISEFWIENISLTPQSSK